MGFPTLGTEIELHDLKVGHGTSPPMVTACVAQCIYQAVSKASPVLLEPLMDLEVTSAVFFKPVGISYQNFMSIIKRI